MTQPLPTFDPGEYARRRIAGARAHFAFDPDTIAEMTEIDRAEWQYAFRMDFAEALGGLSRWETVPPDVRVEAAADLDGYRREAVTFTTRPGLRAFGYFLVPEGCPPGQPAVLCLPGHGPGAGGIVGIDAEGRQRPLPRKGDTGSDGYSGDFALRCVAAGYPAFALEQIGFGRRRGASAQGKGAGASSCHEDSMAALMLGETMSGWRVWDAMRALDYLASRPEVDPRRLGVMGISGGGLTALFTAALDKRVSAAVVSGYFNTWADSVLAIHHCVDNYVPDLLSLCEMPDLAALIAPRALFVESGVDDPLFPRDAFERAMDRAFWTYAAFDAPGQFGAHLHEGGHRFDGSRAFPFLKSVWTGGIAEIYTNTF